MVTVMTAPVHASRWLGSLERLLEGSDNGGDATSASVDGNDSDVDSDDDVPMGLWGL